ncbi:Immunoglobulin-like fold [Phaffia rhodozyma]|uniref:Immunoglobulin-like fold n=1 Tax=Phaffia rhodozyma TaxID=264483 RepID=A0A0F7SU09_PHARH|nr:Immunoglobulin-like fold [Phaffia rhodozyma]
MYSLRCVLVAITALFLSVSASPIPLRASSSAPSGGPLLARSSQVSFSNETYSSAEQQTTVATGIEISSGILSQMRQDNPALSSVFVLPPGEDSIARIRIPFHWSFSIAFNSSTFKFPSSSRFFSASLADGSPIPSWLKFSNSTVEFHGYTPGPEDRSSACHVKLCGGSKEGEADICDSFRLMVADHTLSSSTQFGTNDTQSIVVQRINFTVDAHSQSTIVPWDMFSDLNSAGLELDGRALDRVNISTINVDTMSTPWLSWNETTMSFLVDDHGLNLTDLVYPSSAEAQSASTLFLPVTISDIFNDTAALRLPVSVYPSLFPSGTPDKIYATPGKALSVDMSYYLDSAALDRNLTFSVLYEPEEASKWLAFSNTSNTLSSNATIPNDLSFDTVNVTYEVEDSITHAVSREVISLSIAPDNIPTHSGTNTPANLGTLTHKRKAIVAGVIGTVFGVVILVLLFHYCRSQERDKHQVDDRKTALENGYAYDDDKAEIEVKDGFELEARAFEPERMADIALGEDVYGSVKSKSSQKDAEAMDYLPFLTGFFKRVITPPQRATTIAAGKFKMLSKKTRFEPSKSITSIDPASISYPIPVYTQGGSQVQQSRQSQASAFNGLVSRSSSQATSISANDSQFYPAHQRPQSKFGFLSDQDSYQGQSFRYSQGSQSPASWESSRDSYVWDASVVQDGRSDRKTRGQTEFDLGPYSDADCDEDDDMPSSMSGGSLASDPTNSAVITTANRLTQTSLQAQRVIGSPSLLVTAPSRPEVKIGASPLPFMTGTGTNSELASYTTYIAGLDAAHSETSYSLVEPNTSIVEAPSRSFASELSFPSNPSLTAPPRVKLPPLPSGDSHTSTSYHVSKPSASDSEKTNRSFYDDETLVFYAHTTEAFSFRPTIDLDSNRPLKGVLRATIAGLEQDGSETLPRWLRFNNGLFDGVPRVGDEGRMEVIVVETFSALSNQHDRIVARFVLEVRPGSQIPRRSAGLRTGQSYKSISGQISDMSSQGSGSSGW